MKRLLLLSVALLMIAASFGSGADTKPYPTFGTIERKDPRFDKLIPKGAKIEKLAGGFKWTEGPVWVDAGKFLLFSDIPPNVINKWKEGEGVKTFLKPAGYEGKDSKLKEGGTNGLTLDPQGRLVCCDHGERRVYRLEKDGKKTVLADKYMGKRFNSPNDLTYKSNGDLYFTDPPYGLTVLGKEGFPGKELDFQGIYRLGNDGKLILLNKEMSRPNGIAFSPDEKTLYVANSDPDKAIWMAFPMQPNGTLGKGKVFFDATEFVKAKKKGLPDGMKVDLAGNVFATGPGGVLVFAPDGTHLGTLNTDEPTANCGWGDDGTTLYICANDKLARIKTSTKGKILK